MILFKNGDKFEGIRDQNSNKLNGSGTLKFNENNSFFKGKYFNGKYHGEGQLSINKVSLTGNWINGQPDLKSEWQIDGPNYKYKGSINEEFKKDGFGTLIFDGSCFYKGDFVNDKYQGQGHFKTKELEYKGGFYNNKFHGKGLLLWQNSKYEGDFEMGQFNGKGKLENNEGIYVGDFQNNQKHGEGILQYKNGDQYEGQWLEDEAEGKGKLTQWNKKFGCQLIYSGFFEKGCPEGKGELQIITEGQDVKKYIGGFNEGLFNGEGIIFLDSNVKAEGQFFDNYISGECNIYFQKENQTLECQMKRNQKDGLCSMKIKDLCYQGSFRSNIEKVDSIRFYSNY
ncbi:unnamed protein product [Paramecium pentaurelia]|uniref:MORN repeat protein n=1 Tax=Paramecium pentaurelia TaxID=43138 RepID=A0A8S1SVX3_9CILI|nr:unnamed protein product [Paramecium pentaurelia]